MMQALLALALASGSPAGAAAEAGSEIAMPAPVTAYTESENCPPFRAGDVSYPPMNAISGVLDRYQGVLDRYQPSTDQDAMAVRNRPKMAVLYVHLGPDGKPTAVSFVHSTGNRDVDRAVHDWAWRTRAVPSECANRKLRLQVQLRRDRPSGWAPLQAG